MAQIIEPTQAGERAVPMPILTAEQLAPHFPQYEIQRILGRGGMGAVYLARQISLNRLVAIKILPVDLGDCDMGFAERFKNEAQAMAQLSHPGIVAVFDFGETANGLLYIVMEYIDGTDVAQMVGKQGRLHSAHAMAVTAHVCDALAYAHSRGIIHRDIKPSNIMVSNDGVVKVADFGLAKMSQGEQIASLTQSGITIGTLHFMAPEALTLGAKVDQRADIYAVGVMLYQMLTGKLPHGMFEMPSLQVPGLDPRYDGIVAKALREDRNVRYQQASELRHDLDAILTQPVVKVEPPEEQKTPAALPPSQVNAQRPAGQAYRPPPPKVIVRTKRKGSPLLWLVVFVLGAAAAWMYWERTKQKDSAPAAASDTNTPPSAAGSATSLSATKGQPFVNSLGMKFVPVPITGGPTDGQQVNFCIWHTRVQDYEEFVNETKHAWPKPSFQQGPTHPAVFVSWDDAQAFCQWLTERERLSGQIKADQAYRLPSDHEWSCAVGIGDREDVTKTPAEKTEKISDAFPWGTSWPPKDYTGNYASEELSPLLQEATKPTNFRDIIPNYRDGFGTTSPVGSYAPNRHGLYDMGGNAWQWCEDWYDSTQKGRVRRGPSWNNGSRFSLLSSYRQQNEPSARFNGFGFRCVLAAFSPASATVALTPAPQVSKSSPTPATKDTPYANTLGMKFVPVPGTNVLMCIHETRKSDYAAFAAETPGTDGSWKNPTLEGLKVSEGDDHPVVNVNSFDAEAFCKWLSKKEGRSYRLPSWREWGWAVGTGPLEQEGATIAEMKAKVAGIYPWGRGWPPPEGAGNLGDEVLKARQPTARIIAGYQDGYATTAPVMSFSPNEIGVYDLCGNVYEWCGDLSSIPDFRMVRSSHWRGFTPDVPIVSSNPGDVGQPGVLRWPDLGFRCVLESDSLPSTDTEPAKPKPILAPSSAAFIQPPKTPTSTDPAKASKDAPFVNTLGMKFVPVPDTSVLFCIHETRYQDYAAYAAASPGVDVTYQHQGADRYYPSGRTAEHPVMQVSWEDAQMFLAWLSQKEGQTYRLPTDREWSIAAGIGPDETWAPDTTPASVTKNLTAFPWGNPWPPPPGSGNYSDASRKARAPRDDARHLDGYDDDFPTTAPVMSYTPNPFGLYDMGGNVWEYCADWYNDLKIHRVWRGGSWDTYERDHLLSSHRWHNSPTLRNSHIGFRCVLEINSRPTPTQNAPQQ